MNYIDINEVKNHLRLEGNPYDQQFREYNPTNPVEVKNSTGFRD